MSEERSFVVARGQDVLEHAAPIARKLGEILDSLEPFLRILYDGFNRTAEYLAPLHLEELLPAIYGLILCYFGGTYMMVIAAIEAFRLFGFEKVSRNYHTLRINFLTAKEALRKDSLVDANRDGIADVQQLDKDELLSRQLSIFFKSVNPDEVTEALEGLLQGWFSVIATLKSHFAKYIAIGAAIGDSLYKLLGPTMIRITQGVVPSEYDRWVPVSIRYAFRIFGVSIAWWIARVVNSFYSSLRGAEIFLIGFTSFLTRRDIFNASSIQPGTLIFTSLYLVLAGSGFLLQFMRQYRLSFPFNLFLFPVSILETFLTWAVAVNKEVPGADAFAK